MFTWSGAHYLEHYSIKTHFKSKSIYSTERERVLATVDVDIVNFIFDIFVYQFIALFYRFNGEYFI